MSKLSFYILSLFILMNFLYISKFYLYLRRQYKKAKRIYFKTKTNYRRYYNTAKEKYKNNRIKNNTTEIIDYNLINSLVGYAVIEFLDEYGRILKTQTIFTSNLSIGREESNDIILREQTVSRNQCLITYQNNEFYICHLSKTNPTLLNGISIENTKKLSFVDIIKIANYTLRFQEAINEPRVG